LLRLFAYAGALLVALVTLALATRTAAPAVLALVVGAAAATALLFLQRHRPRQQGAVTVAGLRAPVVIRRDRHGTPHITAQNWHDLFLAQGYIAARDRLWQMEMARRTAAGRLAEVHGEPSLARDRLMRTLGLQRLAGQALAACPPDVRACLEAYAAGVNAFIAEGRLPPEFAVARLRPEPWRAEDSLAVGKLLALEFTSPLSGALVRAQVAQVAGPEAAAALWGDAGPDLAPFPTLADLCDVAACSPQTVAGGAAWAVGPDRAAAGFPLSGCILETAPVAPSPLHPVVLSGPGGARLEGVALAGLPGLMAGRSSQFAWGLAPSGTEGADLVTEPPDGPAPQQFDAPIRVRGRAEPVAHTVAETETGPVLAEGPAGRLVLRCPVLRPAAEAAVLLSLCQAHGYADFRAALSGWTAPGLAAVYAGTDGTVARLETGPVLQEEVNPPGGVAVACPSRYAARRIREVLEARADWNLERMAPLAADEVSLQARLLLQPLLQAMQEGLRQGLHNESLSKLEKQALLLLSDWQQDEPAGSGAACLWEQWYFNLVEDAFRPRMGLTLFNRFVAARGGLEAADRLLLRALSGEENPWLTLEGDLGLPRVALRAFRRAVAYLAARQGHRPEAWAWGREHRVRFRHSLSQALPALAPLVDQGPYPLGGGPATVNRSGPDPAGVNGVHTATTYRRLDDLGPPGDSAAILAPGAGSHPLDPAGADHVAPWLRGELAPIATGSGGVELRLVPPSSPS